MADKPFGGGGDKDDSCFPSRGGFGRGESSSGHERMASEPNPVIELDVTHMEGIIRQYEIEAYRHVLRVFRARADTISWEQEGLLTDLRKGLRLTPDDHLSILRSVGADETVQYMRALRESVEPQPASRATSRLGHDQNPSTSGSGGPLSSFYPQPTYIANQPSTSVRTFVGADRNYPSSGVVRGQFGSHITSGGRVNELPQDAPNAVGWRVRTTPDDGDNFYEAVITAYNPRKGTHTLTYHLPSGPVVESVNLAQISPLDIQWLSNDGGTSYHGGYRAPSPAMIPMNPAPGTHERRGRPPGCRSQSRNDRPPLPPPQGLSIQPDEIRILNTDILIREVERVYDDSNSTPQDRAFARNKLWEHEQSLTCAIARVREVKTIDDDTGKGTDEEARHDLPLLPLQDVRTGPDENQIRDTDNVLKEAERVLNDSNSTAEEKDNVLEQLNRMLNDSNTTAEEKEKALTIFRELSRKASDENAGEGMDVQARHDLPLPPRQDLRIEPDENQIRTDSVLREAERVLNDSNSTTEERVNASEQVQLLLTDSHLSETETRNAINMLQELNQKASDENAGKGADGQADRGKCNVDDI